MLIRLTHKCNERCSHCGIDDRGPNGLHMTFDTYLRALELSMQLGSLIRLLSGGEPTLHPRFIDCVKQSQHLPAATIIASNGSFLSKQKYTAKIFALCNQDIHLQITNDPRFYSKPLPPMPFPPPPQVFVTNEILTIFPCKRTKKNNITSTRNSPSCFNLRSLMHNSRSVMSPLEALQHAVVFLEHKHGRTCAPSVDSDGTVRAGELPSCHAIGHVSDNPNKLAMELLKMDCHTCGLFDKLPPNHQDAIRPR